MRGASWCSALPGQFWSSSSTSLPESASRIVRWLATLVSPSRLWLSSHGSLVSLLWLFKFRPTHVRQEETHVGRSRRRQSSARSNGCYSSLPQPWLSCSSSTALASKGLLRSDPVQLFDRCHRIPVDIRTSRRATDEWKSRHRLLRKVFCNGLCLSCMFSNDYRTGKGARRW